ncbi:hypothetical protein K525DRAFT_285369 [Schizophyllum commune Loenen D]|nr:hypothetical protein K525DRAFT_285369 [Schizophyllum commune Loenen D]
MLFSLSRLYFVLSLFACIVQGDETLQEAARIARTLVANNNIGTMGTIYPASHALAGNCLRNGSLTLITFPISQHTINIRDSAAHSASVGVFADPPGANRPRVSLIGNVTIFEQAEDMPGREEIRDCYLRSHPEARWWVPGEGGLTSHWARFDPEAVYFVGGFGGAHYIGYIPLDVYQQAEPASAQSLLVQE